MFINFWYFSCMLGQSTPVPHRGDSLISIPWWTSPKKFLRALLVLQFFSRQLWVQFFSRQLWVHQKHTQPLLFVRKYENLFTFVWHYFPTLHQFKTHDRQLDQIRVSYARSAQLMECITDISCFSSELLYVL